MNAETRPMCGTIGNLHECPAVIDLCNGLGITYYPQGLSYARQPIDGFITQQSDTYTSSPAIWWYLLKFGAGQWVMNDEVTSFNARNLDGKLWRDAVQTRRGVMLGTHVGESEGNKRYLMHAPAGIAVACLYRDWPNPSGPPTRSMAVITRPPHTRFAQFHSKSTPLFLPTEADTIKTWLNPTTPMADIEPLLKEARLYTDFTVQQVKTYKRAEPIGSPYPLAADPL